MKEEEEEEEEEEGKGRGREPQVTGTNNHKRIIKMNCWASPWIVQHIFGENDIESATL